MTEKYNSSARQSDDCQHVTVKAASGDKSKGEIRFIEYDQAKCGPRLERKQREIQSEISSTDNIPISYLISKPPFYSDLGKNARDIFKNGYHYGMIKLDVKTKTINEVEFNSSGTLNRENSEIFACLESKYKIKQYGLTFAEKWNTDNTIGAEISLQDQLMEGLKINGDFNFSPGTGIWNGKLQNFFNNSFMAINADVSYDQEGNLRINGAAVMEYQGWLAGVQAGYDPNENKLNQTNIALGFSTADFILNTTVSLVSESEEKSSAHEFGGSIFQRILPRLDTGIQINWTMDNSSTRFGIGARYELERGASVRAKINNACQIGLSYQQKLREGITMTLSTLIDAKTLNGGSHKLGLGIEFEG